MSTINIVDARGLFTKSLQDVYRERPRVMGFLRSFFPSKESSSKELSIQVQRGKELIAVDVLRGTEGNRNEMSKSSEKIFVPPYFREWFDATTLDFYDKVFGNDDSGTVSSATFAEWLTEAADKFSLLQDKIERAYELQCAEVFLTGIVTLVNGTNIDFHRKGASLVDVGGGLYWNEATGKPLTDLLNGAKFIRTKGKGQGGVVNVIMGGAAYEAFIENDQVVARADIRNFKLDDIRGPQSTSTGGVLHGVVSSGAWMFRLWTYPEYYDSAAVENIPFIDENMAIIIPEAPRFHLGFASVPKIFRDTNNAEFPQFIKQERAAFVMGNYIDDRADAHVFDIKSAGLPIPVAVDQIYTVQVLA